MALLLPPPDRNYPSFEALYTDIQAHAKTQGYCLNMQAKYKNVRYDAKCDKAGKYVSKKTLGPNSKNKSSKKTNCPMRASAVYDAHENCWKLRIIDPRHNHPPSESPAEHAKHRQDEREQQRDIIEEGLQRGDTGPVIYQAILDQFPDTITSLRDIDNVIQAIKRARREDPEALGPRRRRLAGPVIPDLGKKVAKRPWLPEMRRLKDSLRERDKRIEALEQEKEEFQLRITRLEQVVYNKQQPPTPHSQTHPYPPPPPHLMNHMPPHPAYQVPPPPPNPAPHQGLAASAAPPTPQPNTPQLTMPPPVAPETPTPPVHRPQFGAFFKVITPTTWKT